jgi:hypothetical protein
MQCELTFFIGTSKNNAIYVYVKPTWEVDIIRKFVFFAIKHGLP